MNLLCITHFLDVFDVMNSTVVQNQNTPWSGVWIHYLQEALKPLYELFPVVSTDFHVSIDEAVDCNSRQE